MDKEISLGEILRIEDSSEVLNIKCQQTGIPLWAIARIPFFRFILGDLLYKVPVFDTGGAFGGRFGFRRTMTMARAFVHNALFGYGSRKEYPIMLMSTGARLLKHGEAYFNALSDPFVSLAKDSTLTIEDLSGSKWPFPRYYDGVLIHAPLRAAAVISGRLASISYEEPVRILVDLISQRAKDCIGWEIDPKRKSWLIQFCMHRSASLFPRYLKYKSIYKRFGTRLLIKEEACYGGADNAAAILAAKNLGIVTAEYQHGAVSSGHDAYNFAPAISASRAYREILPDYFLTYGSWWADQINAPVRKVVVGNPSRANSSNIPSTFTSCVPVALILGDGIETCMYIDFCIRLQRSLGSRVKVVFRPHPMERARVEVLIRHECRQQVSINVHQDIYSSFRGVNAVIGEISTGLFDAIEFVPSVYVWNTHKARFGFPVHPFQTFSDIDELVKLLTTEGGARGSTLEINDIWAPDWQKNYQSFITLNAQL